ncbi:MAG: tRNA (adenosine(37)-N6)-threonylcarbamoyltransferase complex ATPase subunit type 1 TsaE [Bdellovibrio bacteriovorus]
MEIVLPSPDAQLAFGEALARLLPPRLVIYLEGDLGTGKTTLVRGILRGLGHAGPVRSPTYTLIEPYELPAARVYHLDLYRLSDPEELEYLGLRDLSAEDALLLVEWPERGAGTLPPPGLIVRIRYQTEGRHLTFDAKIPEARDLVSSIDRSRTP